MFEHIIDRLEGRFDFPRDKARTLVTWVVDQIFAGDGGGPAGFIALFRREGLARIPRSWLGEGPNEPVTPQQVEDVFGASFLLGLALKVGRPVADVRTAVAEILPDVVTTLSEEGQLPGHPPERYRRWLAGLPGAAVGATPTPKTTSLSSDAPYVVASRWRAVEVDESVAGVRAERHRSGLIQALPWAVLAAVLVGGALLVRSDDPERTAAVAPAAPLLGEPASPAAAVPTEDATLKVHRRGERVSFSGVVESHATRGAILRQLERAYGADAIEGDLAVDGSVRIPEWHGGLPALLPRLTGRDATLTLHGKDIDLTGEIDEPARAGLLAEARKLYPGYRLGGLFEGVTAPPAASPGAAAEAFDQLGGDDDDARKLIEALNLMIIHFDTGQAAIAPASHAILERAARALQKAPRGTRIEIGGHTDDTGNAASNRALSDQRAAAVRAWLVEHGVDPAMLTSQGYGQEKPVVPNTTEDGRAENRRIEFRVLP